MDLKDAAKIQLKKTLNDLRKGELEKIDKKLEAKEEIKRVKNAMINREDPESRKLSLVDDQVNILGKSSINKLASSKLR